MADRKEEKSQYQAEYYVNNREEILRKQLSTMRTTAKKFFGRKTNAMRTIVKNGLCTTMLTVKKFCGKKPSTVRTIVKKSMNKTERDTPGIERKSFGKKLSFADLRSLKNLRSSNTKLRSTSESGKKKDIIASSATPLFQNPTS